MSQVEIADAGSDLAELVERACGGEEVMLARNGQTIARIVAVLPPSRAECLPPRALGELRGRFTVPDDFDRALPEDLLDLFEGKS